MNTPEGALVYTLILLLAGIYFTTRSIRFLVSPDDLDYYLRTSPKSKRWVDKHGMEKTKEWSKKYFIPLSFVICFALLGVAIRNLFILVPLYL